MYLFLRKSLVCALLFLGVAVYADDYISKDMRVAGLRGPVLKVVTTTRNSNSNGSANGSIIQVQSESYAENGMINWGKNIRRDAQGRVISFADKELPKTGTVLSYDAEGNLAHTDWETNVLFGVEEGGWAHNATDFTYNAAGFVSREDVVHEDEVEGCCGVSITKYTYFDVDAHGNWTRRLCAVGYYVTYYDEDHPSTWEYTCETREITYDEPIPLSASEQLALMRNIAAKVQANGAYTWERNGEFQSYRFPLEVEMNLDGYPGSDQFIVADVHVRGEGLVDLTISVQGNTASSLQNIMSDAAVWGAAYAVSDGESLIYSLRPDKLSVEEIARKVSPILAKMKKAAEKYRIIHYTPENVTAKMTHWLQLIKRGKADSAYLCFANQQLRYDIYPAKNMAGKLYSTEDDLCCGLFLDEEGNWSLRLFSNDGIEGLRVVMDDSEIWGPIENITQPYYIYKELPRAKATDAAVAAATQELIAKMDRWRQKNLFYKYTPDDVMQKMTQWKNALSFITVDNSWIWNNQRLCFCYYPAKNMAGDYYSTQDDATCEMRLSEEGTWSLFMFSRKGKGGTMQILSDKDIWGTTHSLKDQYFRVAEVGREDLTDSLVVSQTSDLLNKIRLWRDKNAYFFYTPEDCHARVEHIRDLMTDAEYSRVDLGSEFPTVVHDYYLARRMDGSYYNFENNVISLETRVWENGDLSVELIPRSGREDALATILADPAIWGDKATTFVANAPKTFSYAHLSREEATDNAVHDMLGDALHRLREFQKTYGFYRYTRADQKEAVSAIMHALSYQVGEKQAQRIEYDHTLTHDFRFKEGTLASTCFVNVDGAVTITVFVRDATSELREEVLRKGGFTKEHNRYSDDGTQLIWATFSREEATPERVAASLDLLLQQMAKYQKFHKAKD